MSDRPMSSRNRTKVARRHVTDTASDLRSVAGMFLPVASMPQAPAPALPWTESIEIDRGRRGRLNVRHTPGIGSDVVPVVLLHGITLTADVNFFALGEIFGADHPAIVFDAPNHGTGLSVDKFHFTDVADDIVAVLDRLGVTKAIVCGYSLGGIVAMVFGDRHPTRTAGVVVQAAAMRYGVDSRERAFLASVAAVHRLGLDTRTRTLPLRYWRSSARRSTAVRARWAWLEEQMSARPDNRLASVWRAVGHTDHRHLRTTAPTVVVVLGSDRVCPTYLQREVASRLRAHVIDVAADHDLPVANPDAYARVTREALEWVLSQR